MNELVEFCIRHMTHVPCSPTTYKTLSIMTEKRAQLCARVAESSAPIVMRIHDAQKIEQINGTPTGMCCAVTGKPLPSKLGIQLKFEDQHICVHPEVMELIYHYFCIRHFPLWMAGRIRTWVSQQHWFHTHIHPDKHKTIHAYWEPIAQRDFETSISYLQSFLHRCAQERSASLH